MESFWALLKRGYYGTYHRMSPAHLQRYVDEFAGRYNQRPQDTEVQMRMMARSATITDSGAHRRRRTADYGRATPSLRQRRPPLPITGLPAASGILILIVARRLALRR